MKGTVLGIALSLALSGPAWSLDEGGKTVDEGPIFNQSLSQGKDCKPGKDGKHQKRHQKRQGKTHEKFKNMSKEERQAFRKEVKQKWDALSEEEKAEFKVQADKKMETRKKAREERRLIREYGAQLLEQQGN